MSIIAPIVPPPRQYQPERSHLPPDISRFLPTPYKPSPAAPSIPLILSKSEKATHEVAFSHFKIQGARHVHRRRNQRHPTQGPVIHRPTHCRLPNAAKHGLTATYPVIRTPAEQTQFDEMSEAFQEELRPPLHSDRTNQFKQLILAALNIDRCHRLETELAAAAGIDPRIEAYRLRAQRLFHHNLKELNTIDKNRYIP